MTTFTLKKSLDDDDKIQGIKEHLEKENISSIITSNEIMKDEINIETHDIENCKYLLGQIKEFTDLEIPALEDDTLGHIIVLVREQ